ncbi:MAG: ATP-binding protein [Candidatus Binataceae bacterium]
MGKGTTKQEAEFRPFSRLRDGEGMLSSLAANLPARVWVKNSRGRYVYVNQCLCDDFDLPPETWIGSSDEVLFPDLGRGYSRKDSMVLSSGQPLQTIELVERRGRQEYAFVLRFRVEVDGVPHLVGVGVEFSQEISALVTFLGVQEQLFRSERLRELGELASGLAHDLNNSLNAASLRLQWMRTTAGPELIPELDVLSRSIGAAIERVKGLNDFVLARRDAQLQPVDLAVLVREAIEMVDFIVQKQPTAYGGRIKIDCKLAEELPRVNALPTELEHVIANLLLNARDAMPEGGTVTVAARLEPSSIEITVADEGCGIAPEALPKLFDPFFTTKPTGSGLGLWMARDVITRIGGHICAANHPSGGAVFTLSFPRSDVSAG